MKHTPLASGYAARTLRTALTCAALAAALVACTGLPGAQTAPASPPAAPAPGTAPAPGAAPAAPATPAQPAPPETGKGEAKKPTEFVFATLQGPINLDPVRAYTSQESQVYTAIYEGLVSYDPSSLQPVPAAARRWDISDDGLFYRFYLREDGRFSNGDPVTAKVFRDSWFRILDPKSGAEYSTFFDVIKGARAYRTGQNTDPNSVGIRVISDYVLEVELEKPAGHFLKLLCHMSFVPIHPFYQHETDWQKRSSIVGNGPFYIYEKNDNEIVFLRNNLYWDRANVKVERLVMRFLSDPAAASEGFNQGKIDWATSWDTASLDDTSKIVVYPLYATTYYFVRSDKEPWSNPKVRRALALLVPWDQIRTDQVYNPTARLVPQVTGYPDVQTIEKPDKEAALKLLAEAGYPQGHGLPKLVFSVAKGQESERVANIFASAWKDAIGLDVEVSTVDPDSYFSSLRGGGYTVGQMTWIGDFADPLTFLQMWTSDSNLNDAHYKNPEYDKLVAEGVALDGQERYQKFAQAESIILTTGVILPVNHPPSLNLIDLQRIDGWYPNFLDIHPFKYIGFKGPKMLPNVVER